jgi:hypothetical protein
MRESTAHNSPPGATHPLKSSVTATRLLRQPLSCRSSKNGPRQASLLSPATKRAQSRPRETTSSKKSERDALQTRIAIDRHFQRRCYSESSAFTSLDGLPLFCPSRTLSRDTRTSHLDLRAKVVSTTQLCTYLEIENSQTTIARASYSDAFLGFGWVVGLLLGFYCCAHRSDCGELQ